MKGLIPSQIGFAERVRPQGDMGVVWEEVIKRQVEIDEARDLYRVVFTDRTIRPEKKTHIKKVPFINHLKALIP